MTVGRVATRNQPITWLRAPLLDLLRAHRVALAIIDHPWMPRAAEWFETIDPVTADFAYVRWLGDRYKIEEITRTWDRLVVDRARETERWAGTLRALLSRNIDVYGYFNNHYGGYAVGSIELLTRAWAGAKGASSIASRYDGRAAGEPDPARPMSTAHRAVAS